MDGASEQFLSRSAGALYQHGAPGFSDLREYLEQLHHRRAATDNVFKSILLGQFLSELFDLAEVLECLDASDNISVFVLQLGGGDSNRKALTVVGDYVSSGVDYRIACAEGLLEHAGVLADARSKHFAAWLAYGFLSPYACNIFSRPIERGNPPIEIDGEYAFVDRVQNDSLTLDDGYLQSTLS